MKALSKGPRPPYNLRLQRRIDWEKKRGSELVVRQISGNLGLQSHGHLLGISECMYVCGFEFRTLLKAPKPRYQTWAEIFL